MRSSPQDEPFRRAIIVAFPVFSGEFKFFYRDLLPEAVATMEAEATKFFADLAAQEYGSPTVMSARRSSTLPGTGSNICAQT